MKRREFITFLGGAAVAWPLVARAQQAAMPLIGWLAIGSRQTHLIAAFHHGLNTTGYVESRNVLIDYRQAEGRYDQLPAIAADLVRRQVAVIVTSPVAASGLAARAATATIPIVFVCLEDPVKSGLVVSLNRPGENVTGASFFASPLEEKRMELLHELLPTATRIGMLVNPTFQDFQMQVENVKAAARKFGQHTIVVKASSDLDFDSAFTSLVEERADALLVASDPALFSRRGQLVTVAARHAIPAIYNVRQYTEIGGLLSYGTNPPDAYRQAGVYTGRLLKGERPADLPVVLPSKYELVINLKTAKALGLEVPPTLLARADEVIE